jgi:hypothetical protein
VCFYLVAATWPVSEKRLETTLRIINWTGLAIILWSLTQAAAWEYYNRYPPWLRYINELISIGPLIRARASGFTLEPSWLAHQLNLLYLPLWLAAAARRHSVHRFRLWVFTFEDLLLAGGAAALFFTLSRVGLIAFLLMVSLLLLSFTIQFARWVKLRLGAHRRFPSAARSAWQRGGTAVVLLCFGLIYAAGLFGLAQGIQRIDPRMKTMFQFNQRRGLGPALCHPPDFCLPPGLLAGWLGRLRTAPLPGRRPGQCRLLLSANAVRLRLDPVRGPRAGLPHRHPAQYQELLGAFAGRNGHRRVRLFRQLDYLLWRSARSLMHTRWRTGRRLALAGQLIVVAFL